MIEVSVADRWVADNADVVQKLRELSARKTEAPPLGYASQSSVAQELGVSNGTIYNWIKKGSVKTWNGMVHTESAKTFHSSYIKNRKIGTNHFDVIGRATISRFSRLIGRSSSTTYTSIKRGLPYDHKLGIPIREALEWVRDNRPDIVIPPEAWPSDQVADNDNKRPPDEDAA